MPGAPVPGRQSESTDPGTGDQRHVTSDVRTADGEGMTVKRLVVAAALLTVALTGCTTEAKPLLAKYGLDGMGTVEIVDHLDRLDSAERPTDLMASVRPGELVVSSGDDEFSLEIPEDRFYLSVAPYTDQTHECFYHSLTTCKGELAAKDVQVQIVDAETGKVLVDQTRTTFDNGFVGFWLPRGIEGSLKVTHDGQVGEVDFATDEDAPTCVTTLRLA